MALLDSDDAFHPRKLELQTAYLEAHPEVGLVGTVAFAGLARTDWPVLHPRLPARLVPLHAHVVRTRFCPSSALFRRSLWEAVGGFDPAVSGTADRDYWIRSAAISGVAILEAPLTFYRYHEGAMNRNTALMIAHERAVLDKAFKLPELRGRLWLRWRAYGLAALSAAYMHLCDAGHPHVAAGAYLKSFLYWPLPFCRSDTKRSLYRLRFGLRLARGLLTRR
jgi:hypothetical protein